MNWALAEVERTLEEGNNMTDLAGYNDNCIAIAKLVGVPFIELKTLLVLLCTQMHHASRPLRQQCQSYQSKYASLMKPILYAGLANSLASHSHRNVCRFRQAQLSPDVHAARAACVRRRPRPSPHRSCCGFGAHESNVRADFLPWAVDTLMRAHCQTCAYGVMCQTCSQTWAVHALHITLATVLDVLKHSEVGLSAHDQQCDCNLRAHYEQHWCAGRLRQTCRQLPACRRSCCRAASSAALFSSWTPFWSTRHQQAARLWRSAMHSKPHSKS